jgi:TonB family protein
MIDIVSYSILPSLANHLWQSTLVAVLIAGLTQAMSRNRACTRHAMWLAASIKFAIPFWGIAALGAMVNPGSTPPAVGVGRDFYAVTAVLVEPVSAAAADPGTHLWAWGIGLVWLAGASLVAGAWSRRWIRARRVVRSATPRLLPGGPLAGWSDVRVSSRVQSPAVFGVLRPALVLPSGIEEHLSGRELQAILAHEAAHLGRRDNLTTAFHAAVTTLFWFHPLVWWIGRRLVEERERAADEAALAAGFAPRLYARGLLKVCRSALRHPLECAAHVDGSDLKRRIEGVMRYSEVRRLHPVLWLSIGLLAILSLSAPVIVGWSTAFPVEETRLQDSPVQVSPETGPATPDGDDQAQANAALRQWVEQDVIYIIDEVERDAFEALATDQEREQFIEQFWRRRDPTPDTIENEYREEHYRRIVETNRRFAFGETAGWESDRGRIYIVYGEPVSIESGASGAGQPTLIATQRWRYDYIEGLGSNVVLTFVDVNRAGQYRLQSPRPTVEAPEPGRDVQVAAASSSPAGAVEPEASASTSAEPEAHRIGAGVLPPTVISSVQPEYSEEAREAQHQGGVILEAIVHATGSIEILRVVRSLGFGLDERAIEALQQWEFRPGTLNGEPVDVALHIEVWFNLR